MSESETENTDGPEVGVSDDKLPEDLQPGEDNPLAEGLDDNETVDDLLDGGKNAEQLDEDGTTRSEPESEDSQG